MSSLAQDELGHAPRSTRSSPRSAADGRDADAIAYDRQPDEYRHARLLDHGRGDWAMTIARRYLYDTADGARLEGLAGSSFQPLRELVDKIRREERYHVMHATTWLERLAARRRRAPRAAARRARGAGAGRRDRVLAARRRAAPRGGRRPGRADAGPRGSLAGRRSRPSFVRLGLPMPPAAADPDRGRTDHREPFRLALDRVHVGPPFGPGGDVVTAVATSPRVSAEAVRAALAEVADPEIPAISIVDLGIVERADVAADGRIEVELLPTFVGCPAIDAIRRAVERAAGELRPARRRRHHVRGPVDVRPDHGGRPARASGSPASRRRRSPRTSAAPTAAPRTSRWTTCSARPCVARSSTAEPAASRSSRSRRSEAWRSSGSSGPGRWAPGSPSSPSSTATRSCSTTSTRRRSSAGGSAFARGSPAGPRSSISTPTRSTTGSTAGSPASARPRPSSRSPPRPTS